MDSLSFKRKRGVEDVCEKCDVNVEQETGVKQLFDLKFHLRFRPQL